MIRNLAFGLALAAAACGGKKPAPATTTTTTTEQGTTGETAAGGGPMSQHEEMPPEMAKFHDLLAPRWHAEKGPQRMKDTCAAVPDFKSTGDALAKATPPTKANADTWTAGTRALVAAIVDLEATCKANDATKFEAAFAKMHEAFHALMQAAGMHHGEHQGGEHGDHKL
jgi:hypothetical protein